LTCEKLKIKIFRDIIKVNIGAKGCDYDEPRSCGSCHIDRRQGMRREERKKKRGERKGNAETAAKSPDVAMASFQLWWLFMAFTMCL